MYVCPDNFVTIPGVGEVNGDWSIFGVGYRGGVSRESCESTSALARVYRICRSPGKFFLYFWLKVV